MKDYVFDGHKLIYHSDRVNEFLTNKDCFPLYMEISLTGACNHRCVFCAYDFIGHPSRKLETDRLLRFIEEIAACGIKSLLFAGEGEPLLHPDIDKIIAHSKKMGIDVGIYTNGQLLNSELSEKILPSLTFLRFSFNGGTEENYAAIHNVKPEAFNKVISNVDAACRIKKNKGLSVDIGAQYVLIPENMDYLIRAAEILKNSGADYLAIKPFIHQSALQSYRQTQCLKPEDLDRIFDEAEKLSDENFKVIARRESFDSYGKRIYRKCFGTSIVSVLNSAGDVATCLPYWDKEKFVFGNIYSNSFKEIWSGERRLNIKDYLEQDMDTKNCPPNCRPNAINEFLWELKRPSVRHINFV